MKAAVTIPILIKVRLSTSTLPSYLTACVIVIAGNIVLQLLKRSQNNPVFYKIDKNQLGGI